MTFLMAFPINGFYFEVFIRFIFSIIYMIYISSYFELLYMFLALRSISLLHLPFIPQVFLSSIFPTLTVKYFS